MFHAFCHLLAVTVFHYMKSTNPPAFTAAALGHGFERELVVLLAHGVAHLLGHDHHEPDEAAAMAEVEARLLAAVEDGLTGLVVRAGAAG